VKRKKYLGLKRWPSSARSSQLDSKKQNEKMGEKMCSSGEEILKVIVLFFSFFFFF
jgi:hypothetical protein